MRTKKTAPREKKIDTASIRPGSEEPRKTAMQKPSVMTSEEHAIAARIMADDKDWLNIDQYSYGDFDLAKDPFMPPPEAVKLEKACRFKFAWRTRTPQRIEQLKSLYPEYRRWWPVNSVQPTGDFRKYVDSVTGGVHREDQILVFKPWKLWEFEKRFKTELADRSRSSGELMSREQSRDGVHIEPGVRGMDDKPMGRIEVRGDDVLMPTDPSVQAMLDQADGGRISEGVDDLIDA